METTKLYTEEDLKKHMVDFANHLNDCYEISLLSGVWIDYRGKKITTPELLEIYLKEKGL